MLRKEYSNYPLRSSLRCFSHNLSESWPFASLAVKKELFLTNPAGFLSSIFSFANSSVNKKRLPIQRAFFLKVS